MYNNSFPIRTRRSHHTKPQKQRHTTHTPTQKWTTFTYIRKETTYITNLDAPTLMWPSAPTTPSTTGYHPHTTQQINTHNAGSTNSHAPTATKRM